MGTIKNKCVADATRIGAEKSACMADLAKAQPFVDEVISTVIYVFYASVCLYQ